jgi:CubicO group peptidase (beta-lactamase class C family)
LTAPPAEQGIDEQQLLQTDLHIPDHLWLTPRDMAKFCYLYLNHGRWEHATILSPAWVSASTQQCYPGDPRIESIEGYGYLWWIAREHDVAVCYAMIRLLP